MSFQVKFMLKYSELDIWDEGCQPDSTKAEFIDLRIEADTIPELLDKVCKRFKVSKDALVLNSCEEEGRLDVQLYSKTRKGTTCTYNKYEQAFRNGEINLYLIYLIGIVTASSGIVDLSHS